MLDLNDIEKINSLYVNKLFITLDLWVYSIFKGWAGSDGASLSTVGFQTAVQNIVSLILFAVSYCLLTIWEYVVEGSTYWLQID